MWRVLSHGWRASGGEQVMCSRRFLRHRGARMKKEVESTSPVEVQSIRAGGMPAAPVNSLDDIRTEILRMRASASSAREEATSEEVRMSSALSKEASITDGWRVWMEKLRPSEAYYKGQDVVDCVNAKDRVLRRQLFLDAEEVLRKKNKEDTLRYLQLVYGQIGSHHRDKVMEVVNALAHSVEHETQRIVNEFGTSPSGKSAVVEDDIIPSGEARQMAWVNVLSGMSDEELRNLWKWGILDMDTIESLASVDRDEDPSAEDLNSQLVDQASESSLATAKDNSREETEEDGNEDAPLSSLSIEENVAALRDVSELQELMSCVSENMFLGLPTIDLAAVMLKVQQKRYEDISERELRLLERYEETKLTVALSTDPTSATRTRTEGADDCASATPNNVHNGSEEKGQNVGAASDEGLPRDVPSTEAKKAPPTKMELTGALMDRAFSPSNRFLYAITRCDDAARRSFDGMERIKRRALLDPVFQAAVAEAHVWEEVSVRPHLQSGRSDNGKDKETIKQRRLRRIGSGSPILGGPFAKPQHSADVPLFYGNIYSFVPPQGRYNMPAPRLSREETAQLRGSGRKKSRMRYVR